MNPFEKKQQIKACLSNDDEIDSSQQLLEELENRGWDENLPILFELLLDKNEMQYWPQIIITLWYALGKNRILPIDYTIAVLNYCLERSDGIDGNLVWSITRNLKKIAYDSDYDPYQDKNVWNIMQQLKRTN